MNVRALFDSLQKKLDRHCYQAWLTSTLSYIGSTDAMYVSYLLNEPMVELEEEEFINVLVYKDMDFLQWLYDKGAFAYEPVYKMDDLPDEGVDSEFAKTAAVWMEKHFLSTGPSLFEWGIYISSAPLVRYGLKHNWNKKSYDVYFEMCQSVEIINIFFEFGILNDLLLDDILAMRYLNWAHVQWFLLNQDREELFIEPHYFEKYQHLLYRALSAVQNSDLYCFKMLLHLADFEIDCTKISNPKARSVIPAHCCGCDETHKRLKL